MLFQMKFIYLQNTKKDFQKILGSLVYKPQGKITLVPESDKRPPIQTETAEADFKEDE